MDANLSEQLAETDYHGFVDPRFTHECEFGTFYSHPDFPDRHDANQLCRTRCTAGESDRLIEALDRLRSTLRVETRQMSGGDPVTWAHLGPELKRQGWSLYSESMMLFTAPSRRKARGALDVRSVAPTSPELEAFYTNDGEVSRGFVLNRSQFERVGGEYLVGFLNGEPVCCTGWYPAAGYIRFRHVFTTPSARGRGCATSLIHHVQELPAVKAARGLVIMVAEGGPKALYEQLGFREASQFWGARSASTHEVESP